MYSSKLCGTDMIVYSTIIAILLSSVLTEERKELIGNMLMTIGQALITAESACEACDTKVSKEVDHPCAYTDNYNQAFYK